MVFDQPLLFLGSEAIHEAGMQVSWRQRLVRSADMLARYVWFPAHRRLLEEEVQHGSWGHYEPGRHRVQGCRQKFWGYNQKRTGVRGKLSGLLPHGPNSWWVNSQSHWAFVTYLV